MGFSFFLSTITLPFGSVVTPVHDKSVVKVDPVYTTTLTAYNAVPAQTDSSPLITASGMASNPEIVMARSADLAKELPFGTIVAVDGSNIVPNRTCGYNVVESLIGYRIIADTMNVRYTNRIDVLFNMKDNYIKPNGKKVNAANILGVCKGVTLRIVGRLNASQRKHIPKTQFELVVLVEKGSNLAIQ